MSSFNFCLSFQNVNRNKALPLYSQGKDPSPPAACSQGNDPTAADTFSQGTDNPTFHSYSQESVYSALNAYSQANETISFQGTLIEDYQHFNETIFTNSRGNLSSDSRGNYLYVNQGALPTCQGHLDTSQENPETSQDNHFISQGNPPCISQENASCISQGNPTIYREGSRQLLSTLDIIGYSQHVITRADQRDQLAFSADQSSIELTPVCTIELELPVTNGAFVRELQEVEQIGAELEGVLVDNGGQEENGDKQLQPPPAVVRGDGEAVEKENPITSPSKHTYRVSYLPFF